MKEEEKLKYKVKCFRISEETYKKLKLEREKKGKSWNRFFCEILKKYEEKAQI